MQDVLGISGVCSVNWGPAVTTEDSSHFQHFLAGLNFLLL